MCSHVRRYWLVHTRVRRSAYKFSHRLNKVEPVQGGLMCVGDAPPVFAHLAATPRRRDIIGALLHMFGPDIGEPSTPMGANIEKNNIALLFGEWFAFRFGQLKSGLIEPMQDLFWPAAMHSLFASAGFRAFRKPNIFKL